MGECAICTNGAKKAEPEVVTVPFHRYHKHGNTGGYDSYETIEPPFPASEIASCEIVCPSLPTAKTSSYSSSSSTGTYISKCIAPNSPMLIMPGQSLSLINGETGDKDYFYLKCDENYIISFYSYRYNDYYVYFSVTGFIKYTKKQ